jgi:hypothetical protein
MRGWCPALLAVIPITASAGELGLEGELAQSALVVGHAPPGARVVLDGRELRVAEDGRFLLGFGRDHPPEATLELVHADGRIEARTLRIAARDYDIQRIDGLPARMVRDFDEETVERILAERERIDSVKARYSDLDGHREEIVWPAIGPISGIYGSQRILDGEPRAPHLGVDVASPTGTPVVAMASGLVALADPDLFFTGGTVFLDHGHGLTSVYAHLDEVLVEEGDPVAQGDAIGAIGATGRVTGPHLHWGVYWLDQPIDPERLVEPMPER